MAENIDLESVFDTVRQELARLLQERDETIRRRAEIEQQLTGLKQTITGLLHYSKGQRDSKLAAKGSSAFKALLDRVDDASPALTLTDACRRAFTVSQQPLCASDLKDYLEAAGYDFESYKSNPLISIHSVLKRLQASKEIAATRTEGATTYYTITPKKSFADALVAIGKIDFGNLVSPTLPPTRFATGLANLGQLQHLQGPDSTTTSPKKKVRFGQKTE